MTKNPTKTAPRTIREWLESIGESPESIEHDLAVCREHPESRAMLIEWARADRARKAQSQAA